MCCITIQDLLYLHRVKYYAIPLKFSVLLSRPQPIMLNFLLIMLLSIAQKFTNYAQYYAHFALIMSANFVTFKSIDCSIRVYSGLGIMSLTSYINVF